ncbi:ribokinase [Mycetocola tolaasinivorans]|uniref:Ribokinase n=1 Tax=Mycetocola tolaasinivorans TaxID=76635 RepID=A0A3L7A5E2_9MICO|nr:PfkB family carbohydrate kinase [Mycetocola tolaasinivorans]RLP75314.1 ribokinase [Mycetocola tolaasinivorans]
MHFPHNDVDVLVIGSVNLDTGFTLPRAPRVGETIAATGMVERGGGKGANQAFAAARAGASTTLLAAVGTDADPALADLRTVDVTLGDLVTVPGVPTGRAVLLLSGSENTIVVNAGANAHLAPEHVHAWAAERPAPRVVALQHEVEAPVIDAAIDAFGDTARIVLNPSPWRENAAEAVRRADIVVLNEVELEQALGLEPVSDEEPLAIAQRLIGDLPGGDVVVTLGGDGALVRHDGDITHVPAIRTVPVDTVGAGDAFLGTLTAALARGEDLVTAATAGASAAAVVVTIHGARDTTPVR